VAQTYDTGSEIPVLEDDGDEFFVALLSSAISVNIDRERLSNTNGVGQLDQGTAGKSSRDERFGCHKLAERT
jgi:hypothetical protein